MDETDDLEPTRAGADEGSEQWQRDIGNAIVSLVTVLFAPLLAIVAKTTIGMVGLILLVGGATAIVLGVSAIASPGGRGMATSMAIFGCIFGAIEIVVGLNHIGSS